MEILKVENLCFNIGNKTILKDVNFTISEGEIIGLIGANGAGKSTLINCIVNFLSINKGQITFYENKNYEFSKNKVGCLPESIQLFDYLTVQENIDFISSFKPLTNLKNDLNYFQIEKFINYKFKALSLGNKQRLGLTIALNNMNDFYILDEPLNGLDPNGVALFRNKILDYKNSNKSALISSHIISELEHYCSHFIFVNNHTTTSKMTSKELVLRFGSVEEAYFNFIKNE